MFFDTPAYFVFLVLVVVAYWRLAHRRQNLLLLAASYFFYGWWDWRFLTLIATSTVVDYYCARLIAASDDPVKRKWLVAVSLSVNLSFLGFFKYFNFFVDSMVSSMAALGVHHVSVTALRILLPPGISFYTFQEVAYVVDVYRRKIEPSRSLVDYALFISLFPHLIAGPIQQPSHLLPQVQAPRKFDATRFFDGLMLIASGLFRKCVIADNCALIANAAFDGSLGPHSLWTLALGAYAFAWQIYGDFSGYSDIARGSAQLLGFHFMVNFRQPYLAPTVQDFWKRWHISLSTWLRDYLYLPVSYWFGRRVNDLGWLGLGDDVWIYGGATIVTMLLGGLWHGANWTFVVWGGVFGLLLAGERIFWTMVGPKGRRNPLRRTTADLGSWRAWGLRAVVFNVVCLTWVLFRSQSFGDAWRMLSGATTFGWRPELGAGVGFLGVLAGTTIAMDVANEWWGDEYLFASRSLEFKLAAGLCLIVAVTLFSANELNAFVYFQF